REFTKCKFSLFLLSVLMSADDHFHLIDSIDQCMQWRLGKYIYAPRQVRLEIMQCHDKLFLFAEPSEFKSGNFIRLFFGQQAAGNLIEFDIIDTFLCIVSCNENRLIHM